MRGCTSEAFGAVWRPEHLDPFVTRVCHLSPLLRFGVHARLAVGPEKKAFLSSDAWRFAGCPEEVLSSAGGHPADASPRR